MHGAGLAFLGTIALPLIPVGIVGVYVYAKYRERKGK